MSELFGRATTPSLAGDPLAPPPFASQLQAQQAARDSLLDENEIEDSIEARPGSAASSDGGGSSLLSGKKLQSMKRKAMDKLESARTKTLDVLLGRQDQGIDLEVYKTVDSLDYGYEYGGTISKSWE